MFARHKGEWGLLLVTVIWGFGFPITDIALNYASPYQILMFRFGIATLLLSIVFHKHLKHIDKGTIVSGIVVGIFLFVSFLLQTVGLQFTTPSKSAFLTTTYVVMVPMIGFFLFRQNIGRYAIGGAVLALLGTALLSWEPGLSINPGDTLSLLCALGFACHVYFTGHYLNKGEDPVRLTIVQMAVALVCACVAWFWVGEGPLFDIAPEGWLTVFYMGVVSMTVSYLLQTVSQKYVTNQTKAVVIMSMESVFGTAASILILSEVLTGRMFLGCVIILAGVLLSQIGSQLFNLIRKREC